MKKWILFLLVMLIGCSHPEEEVTTTKDMTFQKINPYIGTYIGGNQHSKILRSLPAGETISEIRTDDDQVRVKYRYKESILPRGSFYEYWREEGQMEQTFIYNAIILSLLIPDSEGYHFTLRGNTVSIEREDIMKRFSEEFDVFSGDELLNSDIVLYKDKNQEKMSVFLEDHINDIAEIASSEAVQTSFVN